MLKAWNWSAHLVALVLLAGTCLAQNPESIKFYKLDFVLKEVEAGKVLNARAYSMTMSTKKAAPPGTIRTGSRVPVSNASGSFNYIELGVNIDCHMVEEVGGDLSLVVTADINNTPQEPASGPPVLRQTKWSSVVVVPMKKATLLFSSDDATSKRQMQLELTATPLR